MPHALVMSGSTNTPVRVLETGGGGAGGGARVAAGAGCGAIGAGGGVSGTAQAVATRSGVSDQKRRKRDGEDPDDVVTMVDILTNAEKPAGAALQGSAHAHGTTAAPISTARFPENEAPSCRVCAAARGLRASAGRHGRR